MRHSQPNPIDELERLLAHCRPLADLPLTRDEAPDNDADWVPAVDVDRSEASYRIRLEVPGVTRQDVAVTVEDGILTVSGRKRAEQRDIAHGCRSRRECAYGRFKRSFALPAACDVATARAELGQGLLQITVPWRRDAGTQPVVLEVS